MQIKPPRGERKKGNIDVLKDFQSETFPLIACVHNAGFECFVGGASKNDGEYQKNDKYP